MSKNRKFVTVIAMLVFTFILTTPVIAYAKDMIDYDEKGSVTVTITDKNENAVSDVDVSIYKVAGLVLDKAEGHKLVLTDDFAAGNFDLSLAETDTGKKTLTEEIQSYIAREKLIGESKKTGADGSAVWTDLELGVYYIEGSFETTEFEQFTAFCVTLPNLEDEIYNYDVTAKPKVSIVSEFPPITPPPVPQTGQLWWPLPVLVVLGTVCIVIGTFIKKRGLNERT